MVDSEELVEAYQPPLAEQVAVVKKENRPGFISLIALLNLMFGIANVVQPFTLVSSMHNYGVSLFQFGWTPFIHCTILFVSGIAIITVAVGLWRMDRWGWWGTTTVYLYIGVALVLVLAEVLLESRLATIPMLVVVSVLLGGLLNYLFQPKTRDLFHIGPDHFQPRIIIIVIACFAARLGFQTLV